MSAQRPARKLAKISVKDGAEMKILVGFTNVVLALLLALGCVLLTWFTVDAVVAQMAFRLTYLQNTNPGKKSAKAALRGSAGTPTVWEIRLLKAA